MKKKGKKERLEFDEANVREDVVLLLPSNFTVRIFHITGSKSGKEYWIQVMFDSTRRNSLSHAICLCDCPQGKFLAPLSIVDVQDKRCKHALALVDYLKTWDPKFKTD